MKWKVQALLGTPLHICEDYPGKTSDLESSLPSGNILKRICADYIKLDSTRSNSLQDIECKSWQLTQQTMQLKLLENETQSRVGCQEPPEHCQNSRPPSTISQTGTGTASPIFSKIILINFLCLLWTSWWASNKTDGKRYALPPPQSGQCPFELLVYFPRGKFQKEENH